MAQVIASTQTANSTLRAEVVRDVSEWRRMRDQWNALFAGACNASPPLHYDWLMNWWEVFGGDYGAAGEESLRVICFREGDELVGALPLYLRRPLRLSDGGRKLALLSTGEREGHEICPDYLDLLCKPKVRDTCAEMAWDVLCGELRREYDRLELLDVSEESAFVAKARQRISQGQRHLTILPRGACPIADLEGGLESYLKRISSNTRQQARRLLRAARQAELHLEVARSPEEAHAFFSELIDLHQARWTSAGQPGSFASRPFTTFHRTLLTCWHPEGRALVTRLRWGKQTLAVKYGFVIGNKYDFYQSGVRMDETSPVKSPGIVSFLMLMEHLAGQGVKAFDFLRGSSNYKYRLATTTQPLAEIRLVNWTMRSGVGAVAEIGRRAMRKARHLTCRRKEERRSTPQEDA